MSSMTSSGLPRSSGMRKSRDGALISGAVLSLLLHAAAGASILLFVTSPQVAPKVPIMVNMITAPEPAPVTPEPPQELPKPRPVRTKPLPPLPQPVLAAAPAETASPAEAAPAPPPPAAPVAAPAEAAPAVAVVPPRFDAAYLDNPAPHYPPMSRRMGEQGKVMLRVLVNADGSASQVQLKSTSGSIRLDQSALDTVKRWRFIPAKQGTEAVTAWVLVPISFTLGG